MECLDINDTDGGVCLYLTKEEATKLRSLLWFNDTIPRALTTNDDVKVNITKFMNNITNTLAEKNINAEFNLNIIFNN